jgi:hypothetical protein
MFGRTVYFLLAMMAFAAAGAAQEDPAKLPVRYYKLDFAVKELENDKVIHSRHYSTTVMVNVKDYASIRAGTKVPMATGNTGNQYQYYEVGVNIDVRDGRELGGGQLGFSLSVEVSNVVPAKDGSPVTAPMIRQTKWSSPATLPVKKPTTVFSSDDPSGNRKMQLEVTAAPVS